MQRQLEWASGKPFEYVFLEMKGWGDMAKGRSHQSGETMRRSAEYAQNLGLKSEAGRIRSVLASWNALLGDCRQSRAETAASLATVKDIDPETTAALAPALCGDSEQAQTLLTALERKWPLSTQVNAMWGPLSRAAVETNKGNGAEAVRVLQRVNSYDMGWSVGYWATYLRAQAYLRQGNATEAVAEFQKIIDRRGVWPAAVHIPLAHLGLARAAALAGDVSKSRKAYQDFFALWKDADPDVPILVDAKKEYQKLAE
jgi:predicted Zn-dependent protease